MADHRHEEVRRLFDLVLDVPADQRASVLERECGGDDGLKDRILAMIDAAEDERFLGAPTSDVTPSDVGGPTVTASSREQSGQAIDRYKLLQQIGEGGFGEVWMAEQEEPVRRKVALKIIKLGMDTKQVIARFEAERQALAMMDHPNIAKVLDAGATLAGRPYFVMELVKGEPITDYCDKNNLTVDERLGLFQQVCHAVQHAHQKGIIHRDIKPSNVMITLHDGKPVPRVIDFGIAKATNARLTEKTVFTEYRQFIGTPEYMSPEQAEMSGLDIDTRSDVYSLGVLLYELLTGTTPFDSQTLRSAAYGEIQRIIREETPPRPSTRLSTLETLPSVAAHRHTEPKRLGVLLRGDLDWIVMKALEKDRSRRYETANGFAADIQRHLDSEPVTAGPPSAAYRIQKFVRRNRAGVTAAAALGLALILGVIGTSAGMVWALSERDRADTEATNARLSAEAEAEAKREAQANEQRALEEAERAERELARATEIKRLITEMVQSVNPAVARTTDTTLLRGILDSAASRLASGEVADELVAAELHRTIGHAYTTLGLFEESERHLVQSRDGYERVHGPSHPETRSTDVALGLLYIDWQRFADAEVIFEELVRAGIEEFGEGNGFVLQTMVNLGLARSGLGRYADAASLYNDALKGMRTVFGPDGLNTLRCENNLASLYWTMGRYEDAEPLFLHVLETRERVFGGDHPETLGAAMNLANLYRMQRKFNLAEPLYQRTLETMRRVAPLHPNTLRCISNLAGLHQQRGDFGKAEPLYQEALEGQREVLGPEKPETLGSITNLGNLYNKMERYEDAATMFETSLPIKRRVMPGHPWVGYAMAGLAESYRALGRVEDAISLERELIHMKTEPADRPDATVPALNEAAMTILMITAEELRDAARAMAYAERACAGAEASGDSGLWNYLDTLALAQHMTGDTTAAVATQKRAISLMPSPDADPEMHERLAEYEAALAESAGSKETP